MAIGKTGLRIPADKLFCNDDRLGQGFLLIRYAFPIDLIVLGTGNFLPDNITSNYYSSYIIRDRHHTRKEHKADVSVAGPGSRSCLRVRRTGS